MSELRSRKEKPRSHQHHQVIGEDETDNVPRVKPTQSAFSDEDSNSIPAPPIESMNDAASTLTHQGAALNLPPHLRSLFEKRKAELLEKYPDLMTRDISSELTDNDSSMSGRCRFDLIILCILFSFLFYMLYIEYDINVPMMIGDYIKRLLDPGPIQRAEPIEVSLGVEEALQAVRERMKK